MAKRPRGLHHRDSKAISGIVLIVATCAILRWLDPEAWQPVQRLLSWAWIILPAGFAYIVLDVLVMERFGRQDTEGKVVMDENPLEERLQRIEGAIDRLHRYAMEIDPAFAEERDLEREFMSGKGGMFAGMNHFEYVRDKEARGEPTMRTHNIWRDEWADEDREDQ